MLNKPIIEGLAIETGLACIDGRGDFVRASYAGPKQIRAFAAAIEQAAASEAIASLSLDIIERAVHHELEAFEDICCAMTQKTFRLPSGRAVTKDDIDSTFAMRDKIRATLDAICALRRTDTGASNGQDA